ncbi:hypothetical protein Q5P01_013016 [Channa striata]|uniref:RNA-binding Raly-like protein n=1 Tax=Channa striata TaxID=64152 RepID=A0AA88MPX5_CHASR|nr:hypothetical protein Q5P01_013016 [Channa striata]
MLEMLRMMSCRNRVTCDLLAGGVEHNNIGAGTSPMTNYGMNGELRASRTPTAKRGSGIGEKVFDYQRVPCSVPVDPSPVKRPCPSSSASSSSSTAAQRMKRSRGSSKSRNTPSTTSSKLKMAELLAIKKELTVIKVQIDGLLDCVNNMDRQRTDCSACPRSREPSESDSPHPGSVSSLERESPEPGEASEDEPLHYRHYYPHRIKQHQSDLDDDL